MPKYESVEPEVAEAPRGKVTSLEEFWQDFQPREATLEKSLYGKHHAAWAALKTAESLLPFGKLLGLTESGRKEYEVMDTKDKALYLGLSTAEFIPLGLIPKVMKVSSGTGFKTLRKVVKGVGKAEDIKHTPRLIEKMQGELSGRLKPFVEKTEDDLLYRDWGLSGNEAQAVKQGWVKEFLQIHPGSAGLAKRVDATTGKLKKEARAQLNAVRKPYEEKYLKHWKKEYLKTAKNKMGDKFTSKDNVGKVFAKLTREAYGEALDFKSADANVFADVALRMLDDPGKYKAMSRLSQRSIIPAKLTPVRWIFDGIDEMFGTTKNVYEPIVKRFEESNNFAFRKVEEFSNALAERGLGKFKKLKSGEFRFKLDKRYRDAYYAAPKALREIDNLTAQGAPEDALRAVYMQQDEATQKFMDTWWEWADWMYLDHFRDQANRAVHSELVPAWVQRQLAELLEKGDSSVLGQLERVFRGSWDVASYAKGAAVKAQVGRLLSHVEGLGKAGQIKKEAYEHLTKHLQTKSKENTDGLVDYLTNYVTRLSEAREATNARIANNLLPKQLRAFYTKSRTREVADAESLNLGKLVESRAIAQGKEKFFYPEVERVADYAKRLPDEHRTFTAHWIFRMLGQPSPVDTKVANWIGATYGRAEKALGIGSGVWDERRVLDLAYTLNNMVYLGGLGFKPFSAMRNYAQYFVNVPGDLGGIKDFGWLFKGMTRASDPKFRAYVRDELRAIQEFAPELHLRAQAVPGKRVTIKGKTLDLPELQDVRDWGMWMFKMSDRHLRYMTAGASASKWEYHAARLIKDGVVPEKFLKKLNIRGRKGSVARELEELLREGGEANIRQAKNLFINDVIGDTQYLYGITDAPIASHTWGAPAKAAMVFQSWWINYGKLLGKWMSTGDAGDKANRMFTFLLSSAIAEQVMEPLWGQSTAMQTVGFGPFPGEFSEFMIPPTYAPIYHFLSAGINLGKLDLESAERHGKQLLRSGKMFIPGGLQIGQTTRAIREEGFEGLLPSIVRYQQDKDYAPLWGLFE